jgi:hypothetical protein
MDDERIKQALMRAWTRAGESFFAEVLPLLSQDQTKKPAAAPRKRITKKKRSSSRSGSSSEEEAYNPPPLSKKRSPSAHEESEAKAPKAAAISAPAPAVSSAPPQEVAPPTLPIVPSALPTAPPALPTSPSLPPAAAESPSQEESMEEKSVDLKDYGLSSSSSSSSSASPESEQEEEEDPYDSLTFCSESILKLISDLSDSGEDTEKIKKILATFERIIDGFTGDATALHAVLSETQAFQKINGLKASFPPASFLLCSTFKNNMREKIKETARLPQPDPTEEWRRLEKQLQDRIKRKMDTETLATLRRIDDLIPAKLDPALMEVMTSFFRMIRQLQTDAKHSEVQKKAGALYRRWKELQSPEAQSDQRKNLEKKIPGMIKKAKIIKESEGKD